MVQCSPDSPTWSSRAGAGLAVLGTANLVMVGVMTMTMVLLGVGWNLSLLSGSALLTGDVTPRQRPIREGWRESGMGVAAAGGGVASGVVMAGGGSSMVATMGAPIACIVFPLAWVGRAGFAVGEQRSERASSCVEPP